MSETKIETISTHDDNSDPETLAEYGAFLEQIKQQIQTTRTQATLAVNRHLLDLYWHIGREIASRQETHGRGDSVLLKLCHKLWHKSPGVTTSFFWKR